MVKTTKQPTKKIKTLKKTSTQLTKEIPYTKLVYFILLLNTLLLILLFIFKKDIPPEVPLFYGYPDGEDQLTQKANLAIPPLISIMTILINSTIAYFTKDSFIKKTLVIASFAITFLSVLTTVKIVLLVGSF